MKHTHPLRHAGALCWLGLLAPPLLAQDRLSTRLAARADQIGAGVQVSLCVQDAATGEVLFARQAERPLLPASNQKVLTTAAALTLLGPGFAHETRLLGEGPPVAGTLRGDLWLVGGGDPSLGRETLDGWARALRTAGVRRVTGGVVVDARVFEELSAHPDWERGDLSQSWGARVAGLNLDENCQGEAPVADPALAAGQALRARLAGRGVVVAGRVRRPAPGEQLPAQRLASHSAPLPDTLRITNKRSQNLFAECLLKTVGRARRGQGSWEAGAAEVEAFVLGLGVAPGEVHVADGSGLSRRNRVSARAVAAVLRHALNGEHGAVFRDSLAAPGQAGTLARRLHDLPRGARLAAKTGTLTGVRALSGELTVGGRRAVFAFLLEGAEGGRDDLDDLVRILAAELPGSGPANGIVVGVTNR